MWSTFQCAHSRGAAQTFLEAAQQAREMVDDPCLPPKTNVRSSHQSDDMLISKKRQQHCYCSLHVTTAAQHLQLMMGLGRAGPLCVLHGTSVHGL
jgi:hypothetical protein